VIALNVGIGEYRISGNPEHTIKTFALGSCVGVIAYDPVHRVAGLIHVALPDSKINVKKADACPGYFADTGVPRMLSDMWRMGSSPRNLSIKVVGGSNIMDDAGRFDIGKRNVLAIKKILWRSGLGIISEDVGGDISRTVSLSVADGGVRISSQGKEWEL